MPCFNKKEEQLLSLETQKQVFTEYAKTQGYELVHLYAGTIDNNLLKKIIEKIEVSADGKVEVRLKIKTQI